VNDAHWESTPKLNFVVTVFFGGIALAKNNMQESSSIPGRSDCEERMHEE